MTKLKKRSRKLDGINSYIVIGYTENVNRAVKDLYRDDLQFFKGQFSVCIEVSLSDGFSLRA